MVRNHKMTGRTLSIPAGLAIGTSICMVLTLVISIALSRLVSAERMEWSQIGYGIMVMLLVASITGAKAACNIIKRRKLLICVSISVLYWLLLAMVTALFFGGQYDGMGITALIILCGNGLVYIHELRREGGRKSRLHKSRRRNDIISTHGK